MNDCYIWEATYRQLSETINSPITGITWILLQANCLLTNVTNASPTICELSQHVPRDR